MKFEEAVVKVIETEIEVRKKIKEWNLTGYEKVNKDIHIQLLEEVLERARIMIKMEKGK